jgi:hypothetical protein
MRRHITETANTAETRNIWLLIVLAISNAELKTKILSSQLSLCTFFFEKSRIIFFDTSEHLCARTHSAAENAANPLWGTRRGGKLMEDEMKKRP